MAKFIITVRSVSGNAFGGGLGAVRYLIVPDQETPAPSHSTGLRDWVKQVMQTFTQNADGQAVGDLLFVVHGFNVGIGDVITEHGNIAAGLEGKLVCTI